MILEVVEISLSRIMSEEFMHFSMQKGLYILEKKFEMKLSHMSEQEYGISHEISSI
jgi:hypothetical protein